MKKAILIAALALTAACNSDNTSNSEKAAGESQATEGKIEEADGGAPTAKMLTRTNDTVFINKDTANIMIQSYLQSISNSEHANSMASMIINADSLRAYLADTSIRNIKIMFAHTRTFARTSYGQYAGTTIGELTLILAGYDENGDYKFINGNEVMDNSQPCPNFCPTNGTAQYNTFPNP